MWLELVSVLPPPNALPFGDPQWGVALLLEAPYPWSEHSPSGGEPGWCGAESLHPCLLARDHRLHSVPWSLLALAGLWARQDPRRRQRGPSPVRFPVRSLHLGCFRRSCFPPFFLSPFLL